MALRATSPPLAGAVPSPTFPMRPPKKSTAQGTAREVVTVSASLRASTPQVAVKRPSTTTTGDATTAGGTVTMTRSTPLMVLSGPAAGSTSLVQASPVTPFGMGQPPLQDYHSQQPMSTTGGTSGGAPHIALPPVFSAPILNNTTFGGGSSHAPPSPMFNESATAALTGREQALEEVPAIPPRQTPFVVPKDAFRNIPRSHLTPALSSTALVVAGTGSLATSHVARAAVIAGQPPPPPNVVSNGFDRLDFAIMQLIDRLPASAPLHEKFETIGAWVDKFNVDLAPQRLVTCLRDILDAAERVKDATVHPFLSHMRIVSSQSQVVARTAAGVLAVHQLLLLLERSTPIIGLVARDAFMNVLDALYLNPPHHAARFGSQVPLIDAAGAGGSSDHHQGGGGNTGSPSHSRVTQSGGGPASITQEPLVAQALLPFCDRLLAQEWRDTARKLAAVEHFVKQQDEARRRQANAFNRLARARSEDTVRVTLRAWRKIVVEAKGEKQRAHERKLQGNQVKSLQETIEQLQAQLVVQRQEFADEKKKLAETINDLEIRVNALTYDLHAATKRGDLATKEAEAQKQRGATLEARLAATKKAFAAASETMRQGIEEFINEMKGGTVLGTNIAASVGDFKAADTIVQASDVEAALAFDGHVSVARLAATSTSPAVSALMDHQHQPSVMAAAASAIPARAALVLAALDPVATSAAMVEPAAPAAAAAVTPKTHHASSGAGGLSSSSVNLTSLSSRPSSAPGAAVAVAGDSFNAGTPNSTGMTSPGANPLDAGVLPANPFDSIDRVVGAFEPVGSPSAGGNNATASSTSSLPPRAATATSSSAAKAQQATIAAAAAVAGEARAAVDDLRDRSNTALWNWVDDMLAVWDSRGAVPRPIGTPPAPGTRPPLDAFLVLAFNIYPTTMDSSWYLNALETASLSAKAGCIMTWCKAVSFPLPTTVTDNSWYADKREARAVYTLAFGQLWSMHAFPSLKSTVAFRITSRNVMHASAAARKVLNVTRLTSTTTANGKGRGGVGGHESGGESAGTAPLSVGTSPSTAFLGFAGPSASLNVGSDHSVANTPSPSSETPPEVEKEKAENEKLLTSLTALTAETRQCMRRIHAIKSHSIAKIHEALVSGGASSSGGGGAGGGGRGGGGSATVLIGANPATAASATMSPDERQDLSLFTPSFQQLGELGFTRDDVAAAQRIVDRNYRLLRRVFLWYADPPADDGNTLASHVTVSVDGLRRLIAWIGATVPGRVDYASIQGLMESHGVISPAASNNNNISGMAPSSSLLRVDARRFVHAITVIALKRFEALTESTKQQGGSSSGVGSRGAAPQVLKTLVTTDSGGPSPPQILESFIEGPLRNFAEFADVGEVLIVTKDDEAIAAMLQEHRNDVYKVYRAFAVETNGGGGGPRVPLEGFLGLLHETALLVSAGDGGPSAASTLDLSGNPSLNVDASPLTLFAATRIFNRFRPSIADAAAAPNSSTAPSVSSGGLTFDGLVHALLAVALVRWPDPFLRPMAKVRRLLLMHLLPTFRRKLQLSFVAVPLNGSVEAK